MAGGNGKNNGNGRSNGRNGNNKSGNGKSNNGRNGRNGQNNSNNDRIIQSAVSKQVAAALKSNQNYRSMQDGLDRLSGSDLLDDVTVVSAITTASSSILNTINVTPNQMSTTRIAALANLWERYRFTRFRIRYVPSVPNTLACQLCAFIDTDPNDDNASITDHTTLIRLATTQAGAQNFNFISKKTINIAQRSDNQLYYTGPNDENERFAYQGKLYIIQITNPMTADGAAITSDSMLAGKLYLDWTIELDTPQINPSATAGIQSHGHRELIVNPVTFVGAGTVVAGILKINSPTYLAIRHLGFLPSAGVGADFSIQLWKADTLLTTVANITAPLGGIVTVDASLIKLPVGSLIVKFVSTASGVTGSTLEIYFISSGDQPGFIPTP